MITALIINSEQRDLNNLQETISQIYPRIKICGVASTVPSAFDLIQKIHPQLVFIQKGNCNATCLEVLKKLDKSDSETILISDEKDFAYEAIRYHIGGYLLKPMQNDDLKKVVDRACTQIQLKQEYQEKKRMMNRILNQLPSSELMGIPTIEGYEYLMVDYIIRCEGLQKCTRIISNTKKDIISSYNIGEFRKKLEPYGFFSPHKSHLINLGKVKKYNKEGTITLADNSSVPLARRRKNDFLSLLPHL